MTMHGGDNVAVASLGLLTLGHSGATPDTASDVDEHVRTADAHLLSRYGETVTYHPHLDTVTASVDMVAIASLGVLVTADAGREITAIVDRDDAQALDNAPRGKAEKITLTVANSDTTGISSSELDTGGDEISVADRVGKTARRRRVVALPDHDIGMLTVEVQ